MGKELEELNLCINLWRENGGCEFGGKTKCENCAAPYVLLKLINGEILHDENTNRLSLKDWEEKMEKLKL